MLILFIYTTDSCHMSYDQYSAALEPIRSAEVALL